MSYASHTNQFARIDGLDLGGGRLLVPHYGSTTLTLEVQLASSRPDALSLTPCADGAYQVRFTGSTGGIYAIDASSNLLQWVRLLETNSIEGLIYFLDTQAREQPQRFYRTSRRR